MIFPAYGLIENVKNILRKHFVIGIATHYEDFHTLFFIADMKEKEDKTNKF